MVTTKPSSRTSLLSTLLAACGVLPAGSAGAQQAPAPISGVEICGAAAPEGSDVRCSPAPPGTLDVAGLCTISLPGADPWRCTLVGDQPPPIPDEPRVCSDAVPEGTHVMCVASPQRASGAAAICTIAQPSGFTWRCTLPPGQPPPYSPPVPSLTLPWPVPSLQLGFGKRWSVASSPSESGSTFQIVTSVPVMFGRTPSIGLRPELGYAGDRLGDTTAKLFVAGIGPLWTRTAPLESTELRYVPRFLYGDASGRAVGFRHGFALLTVYTVLGLEASHQVLWVEGQRHQDVRLTISFDPALIAGGLILLGGFMVTGGSVGHGRPLVVGGRSAVAPLVNTADWV